MCKMAGPRRIRPCWPHRFGVAWPSPSSSSDRNCDRRWLRKYTPAVGAPFFVRRRTNPSNSARCPPKPSLAAVATFEPVGCLTPGSILSELRGWSPTPRSAFDALRFGGRSSFLSYLALYVIVQRANAALIGCQFTISHRL
jgi:hypothetical protein